jgi:hypothetical protein
MSSIRAKLITALLFFIPFTNAYAEDLSKNTITIPTDEIAIVDTSNIRITVGNVVRIVAKQKQNEEILNIYLEHPELAKKIAKEMWYKVLLNSAKNGNSSECKQALLLYLSSSNTLDEEGVAIIEQVFSENSYSKACVASVLIDSQLVQVKKEKSLIALNYIAVVNQEARLVVEAFKTSELARSYFESQLKKVFKEKHYSKLSTLVSFLSNFYPSHAEKYRNYRLVLDLLRDLENKGDDYSLSDLLPILAVGNLDENIKNLISPISVDLIHRLASRQLDANRAEDAVLTLSKLLNSEYTPLTYQLTQQALKQLDYSSNIITNDQVAQMFKLLTKNNAELRDQHLNYWVNRIDFFLSTSNASDAINTFYYFLKYSPDPSDMNDRIRVKLALGVLDYEDRTTAGKFISEMSTPRKFSELFDLWIAGWYGNILYYVLAFSLPVVFRFAIDILKSKKIANTGHKSDPNLSSVNKISNKNFDENRVFVTATSSKQLNPLFEEYLECLKIFSLNDGVLLKDIKLAYRNIVKEIHPDLNVVQNKSSDNSRFVKLTQTYDRLRELHRMLGRN